jgi:general secretion pathway protein M
MSRNAAAAWFLGLAPRDQRILRLGGIAAIAILVGALLFSLQRSVSTTQARVERQEADLEWMQQAAPTLAAAGPGPAVTPEIPQGQLLVLIDNSVRESRLSKSLVGSPFTPGGGIQVQLGNADFNLVSGWVARLVSQQGLRVEKASITGSATPGVVNASIQLRPPGPAP